MKNKGDIIMKLGTKIIGNFGGYTELWNGEVVDTDPLTKGCVGDYAIDVKWENDGSTTKIMRGELLPNGNGIGYMTEENYYNG
tara:strand:- start:304 stop:552 length:249 start_codon:yes stop_codon:yes gene_type:complete